MLTKWLLVLVLCALALGCEGGGGRAGLGADLEAREAPADLCAIDPACYPCHPADGFTCLDEQQGCSACPACVACGSGR